MRPTLALLVLLITFTWPLHGCKLFHRADRKPFPLPPAVPAVGPEVGQLAPEVWGEDVEGAPLQLSDFRGRVVVVSFWATWCPACRAIIPHEKALVRRMHGRPFVMLGVNGDQDREAARRLESEKQIEWRSWWDGGSGGPVSTTYKVKGWPTILVIDAGGVIRARGHSLSPDVEQTIETLVRGVEQGG